MSNIEHVAIIMDGNGRWAQERRRPRVWGHVRGSGIVSDIVEKADDLGAKALTLYTFSTENWSRPPKEVTTLFKLLRKFLLKERKRIIKNKISFKVIGEIEGLPAETKKLIAELEEETKDFEGLKLSFAFGYGGRNEIIRAVNRHIKDNPGKEISEQIMSNFMYRPEAGDVDLLIRTGGDSRISNFLLWQSAYAELWFTETKWPEFTTDEFEAIFKATQNRERRFGNIGANSYNMSIHEAQKNKESFVTKN